MLIIALLLIVVPVFLLLIAFGVLSAGVIDSYTNYRAALDALGNLSAGDFDRRVRVVAAVAGALVALVALLLLLRELTFGRRVARSTVVDDTPGRETVITSKAVKALAAGAAREVGARSPSVSLASDGRPYRVYCGIQAPESSNYTELATRARENIQQALQSQSVPVRDVEVTVRSIS
jgi:hypothetical protein